jgi:hypothetical protein
MSFYQNLFNEYIGNYILGDFKSFTLSFKVPANRNHGEFFICWNTGPYDLSFSDTLTFNYAFDIAFKNWSSFSVNIAGANPSQTTVFEIVNILNADSTFKEWFTASVYKNNQIGIRQLKPAINFRSYISNTGAEFVLKFNKYAGIADIPSYFEKDTIENRFATTTANNQLIRIGKSIVANTAANPSVVTVLNHGLVNGDLVYIIGSNSDLSIDGAYSVTVIDGDSFSVPVNVTVAGSTGEIFSQNDHDLLTDAGIDYTTVLSDWQHLQGKCLQLNCTKNTVDGSDRIVQSIIYHTGSTAGMLAKKIIYTYDGANLKPDTVMEIPYVLKASDLITP